MARFTFKPGARESGKVTQKVCTPGIRIISTENFSFPDPDAKGWCLLPIF